MQRQALNLSNPEVEQLLITVNKMHLKLFQLLQKSRSQVFLDVLAASLAIFFVVFTLSLPLYIDHSKPQQAKDLLNIQLSFTLFLLLGLPLYLTLKKHTTPTYTVADLEKLPTFSDLLKQLQEAFNSKLNCNNDYMHAVVNSSNTDAHLLMHSLRFFQVQQLSLAANLEPAKLKNN